MRQICPAGFIFVEIPSSWKALAAYHRPYSPPNRRGSTARDLLEIQRAVKFNRQVNIEVMTVSPSVLDPKLEKRQRGVPAAARFFGILKGLHSGKPNPMRPLQGFSLSL